MNKEEPIYIVIRATDYEYDDWIHIVSSLEEAKNIWKKEGGYDRLIELYPDGSMNYLEY